MPYKNPEDKRRWEQEHREERNARRRLRPSNMQSPPGPAVTPDPLPASEKSSGWKILAGIAVGIGVAVLGVVASDRTGTNLYGSGNPARNPD